MKNLSKIVHKHFAFDWTIKSICLNKEIKNSGHTLASQREETTSAGLHSDLITKLSEYRKKRNFNAKEWTAKKVDLFNEYLRNSKLSAAVVSVSGGVDSAVTLGLVNKASKAKDSPLKKLLGIAQPIHSSDWSLNRAREVASVFKVPLVVVDQTLLHTELSKLVDTAVGVKGGPFANGQLRSYMRAPVGYYTAQLLTQQGTSAIVMGTGNKDEDGYLAYFCKAGDGVCDVQLTADLHKSEVFRVGHELGVPEAILQAAPSADLWEGQTDQDELGFSYDFVELFTGAYLPLDNGKRESWKRSLSKPALEQFEKWAKAAQQVHLRNKHKLSAPHNINIL